MCLFAFCVSSVPGCLLRSLTHFLIGFFVFLLVSFKSSLYTFLVYFCVFCTHTSLFFRYFFWIYFLPVFSLSFHSVSRVFCRAEAFNCNEVQFYQFFFMQYVSYVVSKKSFPSTRSPSSSPVLASSSFIVLYLSSRYLCDPFGLIFAKGFKVWVQIFFFSVFTGTYPVVPTCLVESCPFFIELPLLLCQRSVGCIFVGLFLGSLLCSIGLFVSLGLFVLFLPILYCFDFCSFILSLESRVVSVLPIIVVVVVLALCWLFWVFCLSIPALSQFVDIHKVTYWGFD